MSPLCQWRTPYKGGVLNSSSLLFFVYTFPQLIVTSSRNVCQSFSQIFYIFSIFFLPKRMAVIFPVTMAACIHIYIVYRLRSFCSFSGRRLFAVAGKFKDVHQRSYVLILFKPLFSYNRFCICLFTYCINWSIFVVSLWRLKLSSLFFLHKFNVTNFKQRNLKVFNFLVEKFCV